MPRTFIVRHGESVSNVDKIISGQHDEVPLTAVGHEQAREAGRQLSGLLSGPVRIVSSPLERARDTAKHIASALGVPHGHIIFEPDLVERSFGSLEGSSGDELHKRTKRGTDPDWRPDGGESLNDVQARALPVIDRIHSENPDHHIVIVSHGHTLKTILNRHLGTWLSRYTRMGNAEVRELPRQRNEGYSVFFHAWRCADCGHTWVAQDDSEGSSCHACPGEGKIFESVADTLIWRALNVR